VAPIRPGSLAAGPKELRGGPPAQEAAWWFEFGLGTAGSHVFSVCCCVPVCTGVYRCVHLALGVVTAGYRCLPVFTGVCKRVACVGMQARRRQLAAEQWCWCCVVLDACRVPAACGPGVPVQPACGNGVGLGCGRTVLHVPVEPTAVWDTPAQLCMAVSCEVIQVDACAAQCQPGTVCRSDLSHAVISLSGTCRRGVAQSSLDCGRPGVKECGCQHGGVSPLGYPPPDSTVGHASIVSVGTVLACKHCMPWQCHGVPVPASAGGL
jgi:hypothetical protein